MTIRASIVHWNRPAECLATIAAVRDQGLPVDITVVDNHSSDDNLTQLRAGLPPDVELVSLPANVGWGAAHNKVLRRWLEAETSEFCIVSAHDALPAARCVAMLVDALRDHPRWGMACPEYGAPEVPSYSILRGARLRRVPPRRPGFHEETDYCHGTLAVVRRECLHEIGPYDERYFAYGDETEIGIRARRRGWQVGLVWGAVVTNPGSWSGGAVIGYLWTRNSLRLARAFGGRLGVSLRGAYVAAVTGVLWLKGADDDSLSSPRARWLGIRDYFRGCCGAPPSELTAERRRVARLRLSLDRAPVKKLVVGAGPMHHGTDWVQTDRDVLDVTDCESWRQLLGDIRLDNVFAEHVWEHLTDAEAEQASRNVAEFLKPTGTFRVAVPDGFHPDQNYIDYVRPGGHGAGADDHKVLYNYALMADRLRAAGFGRLQLLEYWDEAGQFHFTEWDSAKGHVRRSRRFDERNGGGQLRYTSLIIDAQVSRAQA
jgi:predicted SAM-dependent methyltransferase/GT2 family glycosyltransferase